MNQNNTHTKPPIGYTVAELAKHVSAKIIGDDQHIISRLSPIKNAKAGDLTFLIGGAYRRYLSETQASAVIISEADAPGCPVTALVVENPELAFARIAHLFNVISKPTAGIHPSSVIAKTAVIDPSAFVGAGCVIGDGVVIGARTIIHPSAVIHEGTHIGDDCIIYSNVTIYHRVSIRNRVILHSGVVIGADGFGFVHHKGVFEKMPQLGSVVIGDDVEIGANSCVDRGALDNTVIETGVKIDNLVQIAHNVVVGAHTVIAGCTCIAGSTVIGRHCMIAGAVAISGHLTICDGVIFTGGATVTKSIKEPGMFSSGTGLLPHNEWRKCVIKFRRRGKDE
jgi:UDP-3-O-[3-hydroxymyristoyl] glucosamine N-acyltransferase